MRHWAKAASALRLNLQMETEIFLQLESPDSDSVRSAVRGALAKQCEEVHMLCNPDYNSLLINNILQPPVVSLFNKFILCN